MLYNKRNNQENKNACLADDIIHATYQACHQIQCHRQSIGRDAGGFDNVSEHNKVGDHSEIHIKDMEEANASTYSHLDWLLLRSLVNSVHVCVWKMNLQANKNKVTV